MSGGLYIVACQQRTLVDSLCQNEEDLQTPAVLQANTTQLLPGFKYAVCKWIYIVETI